MSETEAEKFISNAIANALKSGVHQMSIVAILEAHKHAILTQSYDQHRPQPGKLKIHLEEGGGN
jgi:hypothetical protein